MFLTDLALTDFRNYTSQVIRFDSGVNALIGPNGQGKTNVVEAIGYLATLASHRVASDAPLIRAGAGRAVVQARLSHAERSVGLEIEINAGRANKITINRSAVRSRDILGVCRVVVFAPEDLALVKGDPDGRRRFLDDLLIQLTPRMAGVRADYDKMLRQRNALLKSAGAARRSGNSADLRTLDVWDGHVADLGAQLLTARIDLVTRLAPLVDKAYHTVSASASVAGICYRSSLEGAADAPDSPTPIDADIPVAEWQARLLEAMSRLRSKEIERGVSLVGPHRDDLELTLGPLPAKGYASHGESWSMALALRLASFDLLTDHHDMTGTPILILDDVFAELDAARRRQLAAAVCVADQVFVTAAVPEDVPEELSGARFDVMAGEVTRVC